MEGGGERSWERGSGAGVRILRARALSPASPTGPHAGSGGQVQQRERKDDGDDAAPDSFARVAAALRFPSAIDKSSTILR